MANDGLNRNRDLNQLIDDLQHHRISRRGFMQGAAALGLAAGMAGRLAHIAPAAAQSTSTASPTRESYYAQLKEKFNLEAAKNKGGQVIRGDSSDISTVNGILAGDSPTLDITPFIFETLIVGSLIDGLPVPQLADSWETAADGVTYTFHLNKNVKWHDGTPFTADDVKFSVDAQLNPKTGSQYTSSVAGITDSYRVVDPYTFEVKSKGKVALFVYQFGQYVPIIAKHIWASVPPEKWANDKGSTGQDPARVVGTGPMKFKEWVQGDHVTFVRNDAYYDPGYAVNIDEFIFKVLPDDSAAVQALKTGEIDVMDAVPAPQVQDVVSTGAKVDAFDTFVFAWYGYNLDPAKTKLFQEKPVRQALFYALDRQALVDAVLLKYGEVAQGTQPKLSIAYAPDKVETHYNYDPTKANALLDQAGWAKGSDGIRAKNGLQLKFDMIMPAGIASYEQIGAYMQQAWKAVGASMTPRFMPFPSLLDVGNKTHDYQIVLLAFQWDVTGNQEAMFASNQYKGGFNWMKYSNPEYDRINELQKHELDPQKRIQYLYQLENIVNDDLPAGILWFRQNRVGYTTRVHNFHPNGYSTMGTLPFVWVEK